MIVVFSYFYTSIVFNSVDLSENLKKQGAFIPGVKPGAATADYIDDVLGRITLPGSLFLAVVAIVPISMAKAVGIQQFSFGGTSILIVVGVLARHHRADRAAPPAAEVRRLHEVRPDQVPRTAEPIRDVTSGA